MFWSMCFEDSYDEKSDMPEKLTSNQMDIIKLAINQAKNQTNNNVDQIILKHKEQTADGTKNNGYLQV